MLKSFRKMKNRISTFLPCKQCLWIRIGSEFLVGFHNFLFIEFFSVKVSILMNFYQFKCKYTIHDK